MVQIVKDYNYRAELKVTKPNLQLPAVSCENLRFAAKICGFLRPPTAVISWRKEESTNICGFLRKSAFGFSLSP